MASISRTKNIAKPKSTKNAGSRAGEQRHSGAKPSGTNVSRGGGSAAKKQGTSGSGARGKGARGT
ncbi:MAG: hypothetical protein ACJ8HQ_07240 [Chthoniobacterales bacterium]